MTKTYDVVGGVPVPDVAHLSREAAIARKAEINRLLAIIRQTGAQTEMRPALIREDRALADHLRDLKERQKAENARRNFAGLQSPLWDAVTRKFDPAIVRELELAALRGLAEREQRKLDEKKG